MRKLLGVVALLAALYIVAQHFHWKWIYPSTYFASNGSTVRSRHGSCGTVADVHYDASGNGRPTFVDMGHPYPNQDLTILIWGDDLSRFSTPPSAWEGQRICVTGPIDHYHGRPEIIAYGPDQIQIEK